MRKTIFTKEHKDIVQKLIKARKEAGLDQQEVARSMGKTQSYVSKIESGQRRIDIVQISLFAKIYKKSTNYFLK